MSAIMPAIMRLSSLHVYFALINLFNSMQPVISGYRATYNNGYNRFCPCEAYANERKILN